MPPTKAIHYFDLPATSALDRVFGRSARMRKSRAHLWRSMESALRGRTVPGELRWAARLALGPRNDAWYGALFPRAPGLVPGETTPRYCVLPEPSIARIREMMPGAKIIYLIRHPVERSWSSAVMHFNDKGRGGIARQSEAAIERWLTRSKNVAKCDYAPIIRRWRGVFGDDLLVCFYDELQIDPAGLLSRVQSFLGLPVHIPGDVASRQNAGRWTEIPMPHRALLHQLYQEPMAELHAVLPCLLTRDWLHRYGNAHDREFQDQQSARAMAS
jgi:hypothetical protein